MHARHFIAIMAVLAVCRSAPGVDTDAQLGEYFAGQDLHLAGGELTIYKGGQLKEKHVLIFENGFSMAIGDNKLSSDRAAVLVRTLSREHRKVTHIDYDVRVYLEGDVSIKSGKRYRTTELSQVVIERGAALVTSFPVSGQVFANAESHTTGHADMLSQVKLYQDAVAAMVPVKTEPTIAVKAKVPDVDSVVREFAPQLAEPRDIPPEPEVIEPLPQLQYPINIASLWDPAPKIEKTASTQDGLEVATIRGRFYLWQKRDEKGNLLEFMADSGVVYYQGEAFEFAGQRRSDQTLGGGKVDSVYFKGNIVMTEGPRTIRADELFYDFETRRALAVNAEVRNYDPARGIPIYVRAAKLRGVSEDVFHAEDVTLTTSEFYLPQVAVNASELVLTDTTSIDARTGKKSDKSSFDGRLKDVSVEYDGMTIFKWPGLRTNFERPDVPIKKMAVGWDEDFGGVVETRWHLARLLGRKEPEGVDSEIVLDYYTKRGVASGLDIEYEQPDYFGYLYGYILKDHGEDDLGRISSRRDLEPPTDIRGRFISRHRHFLPYDWQLTSEVSYLSDKNFLEAWYRSEFDVGKDQETLVYLKRLKDNWAFELLTKARINDFETETEELPSVEFHLKGASFWDNIFTLYSDTRVSRLRDRLGDDMTDPRKPQSQYTFLFSRNEVALPLLLGSFKVVPYIAGTYAYEDQFGFNTTLSGDRISPGDKEPRLGEVGVRTSTMIWKEDQFLKSRFWDLNGMRHIIKPHFEATWYEASDSTIDMRKTYNFGISQRWQSRRGTAKNLRSFDWMRLSVDATWVELNERDAMGPANTYGPAVYIWNNPAIPFGVRRNSNLFGLVRDSINADYMWRLSDTTSILSDLNYDIRTGIVQQFDAGVSRFVYPDVSMYIGSRYLRPVIVSAPEEGILEKGSHSVVGSLTYTISPRYTLTFSHEYNFDYGDAVRTEATLIRRYHRMYYGLTFAADQSLKRQAVVFSIWPEGVKELAMGRRKYAGLSGLPRDD